MKISLLFAALLSVFLLNSCDRIYNQYNRPTEIYSQKEIKENMEKLRKNRSYKSLDDMKFWDFDVRFSYSLIEGNCEIFVGYDMLDAKDNTKIVNQTYQFSFDSFRRSYNIQVVDADDNVVNDYNLIKNNLFKISDLKYFDKLDDLMQKALNAVDNKDKENYISVISVNGMPEITYTFTIKNKKDVTYKESVRYNDSGIQTKI